MNKVVTRFAPSPTGYIHIGNVRSAIYPYLLAKQAKKNGEEGTFILRIEDTDRNRYVEGATELIMDTLKWLGLSWDEGPEVGGNHGPYFQTERKDLYLGGGCDRGKEFSFHCRNCGIRRFFRKGSDRHRLFPFQSTFSPILDRDLSFRFGNKGRGRHRLLDLRPKKYRATLEYP